MRKELKEARMELKEAKMEETARAEEMRRQDNKQELVSPSYASASGNDNTFAALGQSPLDDVDEFDDAKAEGLALQQASLDDVDEFQEALGAPEEAQ